MGEGEERMKEADTGLRKKKAKKNGVQSKRSGKLNTQKVKS